MVSVSNSSPAVLGVPHAPRIPPLNLVSSASLGKREKSPGDEVGHKYPKGLFPASRSFFCHLVVCSYWIVLSHYG